MLRRTLGGPADCCSTFRGIPRKTLLSHHEHNWRTRVPDLISRAQAGQSIAVVSDAGTPGIADPGMQLAAACTAADVPVLPVPGACAAVTALSVTGFECSEFVFMGFLPRRGAALRAKLAELAAEPRTLIFYEAPHRITQTFRELVGLGEAAVVGNRSCLVAREITKLHEELTPRHNSIHRRLACWGRDAQKRRIHSRTWASSFRPTGVCACVSACVRVCAYARIFVCWGGGGGSSCVWVCVPPGLLACWAETVPKKGKFPVVLRPRPYVP